MASSQYKHEVDTQKVRNSAQIVDDFNQDFICDYTKMYNEVANLAITWKGTSSTAFNNELNDSKKDFENMSKAITEYAENLRKIAQNYEKNETSITEAAKKLHK